MENQFVTPQDLPERFHATIGDDPLGFACHPGVACFTECCRELDLILSPYDVLRLKQRLQLTSGQLLDRYVIVEWDASLIFPICSLTMVDDGRASCVFVRETGCSVYTDRPGSCRAYPLGRGASLGGNGEVCESLVLVREPHCLGFSDSCPQTVHTYLHDQGLAPYSEFNDALLPLVQHRHIRDGSFLPTRYQLDQYMLALYDLEQFRKEMTSGRIALQRPLHSRQLKGLAGDDEELLLVGIKWLLQEWFDEQ